MTFDEWFAGWVKAAPEWNDAAGNYETIASEAWEYQEQQLAELREALEKITRTYGSASAIAIARAALEGK